MGSMTITKRPASRPPARMPRHAKTAETIGRRILGGDLAPGSILPNAAQMAREYKLSRPALREAIKLLAGKGLISAAPRRGTVVRPRGDWHRLDDDVLSWEADEAPSPRFIRDLFELRRMIEPEAAAFAALRASQEGIDEIGLALDRMAHSSVKSNESVRADIAFHRAILTHSGNDFLAAFAPLIGASLRIAIETQRSVEPPSEHFVPSHRAVYLAIRDRRSEDARACSLALLADAEIDALGALERRGAEP